MYKKGLRSGLCHAFQEHIVDIIYNNAYVYNNL